MDDGDDYGPIMPYFVDDIEDDFVADRQCLLAWKDSNGKSSHLRLQLLWYLILPIATP